MIRKSGILAILILSCFACGKTGDYVPGVSVNFQMALANPALNALHNPGGAVIIKGYGVAGLILFRLSGGGYAAYDACSAYLPQNKSAVTLDNPSLTCTDPASGAKWLLEDGSPVKAPAVKSLKEYAVNYNQFEIFVSN